MEEFDDSSGTLEVASEELLVSLDVALLVEEFSLDSLELSLLETWEDWEEVSDEDSEEIAEESAEDEEEDSEELHTEERELEELTLDELLEPQ